MPITSVMTEFWTHGGKYDPYELEPTVSALRKSGQNIVEAEAFTGDPEDSKCFTTWNYFTKDSPLISSGLLGPVRLLERAN